MLICLVIGDVDFDHLVKVVSVTYLHFTVTVFPLKLLSVLWGDTLRL